MSHFIIGYKHVSTVLPNVYIKVSVLFVVVGLKQVNLQICSILIFLCICIN